MTKSSTNGDSSTARELVESLVENYGVVMNEIGEAANTLELMKALNVLSTITKLFDSDPSPENKKSYMEALQNVLNIRAGFIHKSNHLSFLGRDSVADSKLTSDPRLTTAEVALLNSRIKPIDSSTRNPLVLKPLTERQKEARRAAKTMTLSDVRAKLAELDAKMVIPQGLPANWELAKHVDTFESLLQGDVFASHSTDPGLGAAFDAIINMEKALAEVKYFAKPGYVRVKDSSGEYPGILTFSDSTSRTMDPAEVEAMVAGLGLVTSKLDLQSSRFKSTIAMFPRMFDMFVTSSNGDDNPIRVAHPFLKATDSNTLAYANRLLGTTYFANRLANTQRDYDLKLQTQLGDPNLDWWSSKINPGSQDVFKTTVAHEFGHIADYLVQDLGEAAVSGRSAPSRYGKRNNKEKFAEYMAKYLVGESVPPWFIENLRGLGLLKSQQNPPQNTQ